MVKLINITGNTAKANTTTKTDQQMIRFEYPVAEPPGAENGLCCDCDHIIYIYFMNEKKRKNLKKLESRREKGSNMSNSIRMQKKRHNRNEVFG